jgi:hypothetical protein
MGTMVIESCHSTWVFDPERRRFRRILKGLEFQHGTVSTQWRPYYLLEADPHSEYFTVWLNPEGSRLLRSWRHGVDCVECREQVTGPLSLDDIRHTMRL